jgi:TRAP-type C4-dicarboxylate transport system substrate-binding protein
MQLHSTKPVQKLEDFKGMKMRIEGKVEGWTVEELGATGVTMDTLEIYTSLERGLVEGIFFLWEGVLAFGFNEITKYRTECGMFTRGFPTVMNWDTWNSLPADIQEIFNKHSGPEMSAQIGAAFDGANAGAMGAVMGYDKEVGNPGIYILPDDEDARWKAAVAPVIDTWVNEKEAEGVPAKAMLDDAIRLIKQYSK